MKIKLAGIVENSIVDGDGMRLAVFVQGCHRHCPGCHNQHTQDTEGGYWGDTDKILEKIKQDPIIAGVTFSGGEPFEQIEPLLSLAKEVVKLKKTIWIFTGYTYEELCQLHDERIDELLSLTEILVDGPFILDKRDISLRFRGSSNQRLINIPETIKAGHIRTIE